MNAASIVCLNCEKVQNCLTMRFKFYSPVMISCVKTVIIHSIDQKIINNSILQQQYLNKWCNRFARFVIWCKYGNNENVWWCWLLVPLTSSSIWPWCHVFWVLGRCCLCDWACMCVSKTGSSTIRDWALLCAAPLACELWFVLTALNDREAGAFLV